MSYDDWKLETPDDESDIQRRKRERAEWEEEHADYLLEQEREDNMRQMECDDD